VIKQIRRVALALGACATLLMAASAHFKVN
jgi:hypothetical protein